MNPTQAPEPIRDASPPTPKKAHSDTRFGILVFVVALLVGVLVLLLASFLFKTKGRPLQAKAVMKGVEIAIKGYKTEYLRLPFVGSTAPLADTSYSSADPNGNALLEIMTGTTPNNPRRIRFWEPPPSHPVSGGGYIPGIGLIDIWAKKDYRILLDYDKDGHITDPEGIRGPIKADVLLYSAGPDGDFATWNDNVCSWK